MDVHLSIHMYVYIIYIYIYLYKIYIELTDKMYIHGTQLDYYVKGYRYRSASIHATHLLAKVLLDNVKLLVELLVDVVVVPFFFKVVSTPKNTE